MLTERDQAQKSAYVKFHLYEKGRSTLQWQNMDLWIPQDSQRLTGEQEALFAVMKYFIT